MVKGIDEEQLASWLAANVGGQPPFTVALIAGGHSNLTYAIDDAGGVRRVLRRPPLGVAHSRAHDMAREYKIQAALAGSSVPVPKMLALCEDEAVIGAPFYVMNWVEGVVIDHPSRVDAALPDQAARHAAAGSLVDALAALHAVDLDAIGLADLGPRGGYVARQLNRMQNVWQKTKTRELALIGRLHDRLAARIPPEVRACLLHSDFRLGNVLIDPARRQVAAVLDWELAAIGDPRADIAFLLCSWDQPEDPSPSVWMSEPPTRAGGFPSREAVAARYAERTSVDVSELDYFRALAYWRNAVIAEGIKRRYQSGAMAAETVNSADIEAIERKIHARAALAEHFLDRAGIRA